MATVETRVKDAILTFLESLIIPGEELAMKSVYAPSGQNIDSIVPDADQGYFSGNIKSLQFAASSRINSNTDLNRIDETRGNITVVTGDLSVNERNTDRHKHTHHNPNGRFSWSSPKNGALARQGNWSPRTSPDNPY